MTHRSAIPAPPAHVALALCNTAGPGRDALASTDDLARWYVQVGLAATAPAVADDDLQAARALRDGLRAALAAGDGAAVAAIAAGWLESTPGCLCVEPDTLEPRFAPEGDTPRCLMVGAVLDALALVREMPDRVRTCAAPECGALYVDTSRNRSRRWCSMEKCGARAKASAYYRRRRAEA